MISMACQVDGRILKKEWISPKGNIVFLSSIDGTQKLLKRSVISNLGV
jgi:hypothetical protein